jgi:CMP-N-acetylneuraminic acid synthetase
MQVTALMPIKKESERVLNKNKRIFAGKPLFYYVYSALAASGNVSEIIINTDCPEIKEALNGKEKIKIIDRPLELCGHEITMNTLIHHDLKYCSNDHILQTHCTNPLLTTKTIDRAIELFFSNSKKHDSLFSANRIQCRLYYDTLNALNHDPSNMERTQDMKCVYKENSNLFIFSKDSFEKSNRNRIGLTPQIFEMNEIESVDIDYENDFILAELIHKNRSKFKGLD